MKKIFALVVLGIIALSVIGAVCNYANKAVVVAQEEFSPRELLRKYEWFKDAAAVLDKKAADIQVYESRITQMQATYEGQPRSSWPREDREQMNVWASEVAGVKASYNTLASEYNSAMSKFNWRFTNAGDLPQGADRTLPREFRTYVGN